ncbi:nuclear transport factor 2 family protein [Flavihumibacter petaseus]|uniref:DUF4440 domain-containing protein n=1 Tax=Flavihumibacter petaseus NBRC 106054 TaxID=1220578 RepID=A0A0E9MYK8_9BACT|nr:nuclear transport factor 2 family protein [Flavihumibacter petaseus]GAO42817.1 hypothetical protein FPE01S_01_18350 [Flavihumibacter petaseus NBRC 106054]
MRRILLPAFLLTSYFLSAQYRQDSTAVVNLLKADYATLASFDSVRHKQNVTYDYLLVEEGEVWSLARELEYFREKAIKKQQRADEFSIHSVRVSGATAYAVYDLKSVIKTNDKSRNYHWLETAIFRKVGNQWKIALIHSTEVMPHQ